MTDLDADAPVTFTADEAREIASMLKRARTIMGERDERAEAARRMVLDRLADAVVADSQRLYEGIARERDRAVEKQREAVAERDAAITAGQAACDFLAAETAVMEGLDHGKYVVCGKCGGTGLLFQGSRCCHVCNGSGWAASPDNPETGEER